MRQGQIVFCRSCFVGYAVCGELPKVCPRCEAEARWTTEPPYHLTENDKRFLHSIKIAPDAAQP